MEGHDAPALIHEVAPDDDFRWRVRAGGVGLAVVAIAVLVATRGRIPFGGVVPGLAIAVLIGTMNRGELRSVRATTDGLELVGQDGVVRSIPGPSIGGLATTGPVIAGRLGAIAIGWVPNTIGRLVVVDQRGRVQCARRAGWMRVADLEALAHAVGVPWGGRQPRSVPGVWTPAPASMQAPTDRPAVMDPATLAALTRFRRRLRRTALVTLSVPGIGIAALVLLSNLPRDAPGRTALGWIGGVGLGSILFLLPLVLLHADEPRRITKSLGHGPWWPVEAVVVSGLILDATARLLAIVDPTTGEVDVWKVDSGGGRGWLQGDDRTWFWITVDARGKHAVIAPPDRSDVALLEKRALGRIAAAEVRAMVTGESATWAHREWEERAWAEHHAAMRQWSEGNVPR